MEALISNFKKLLPPSLLRLLQLPYHYLLAFLGAILFGFPSRKLNVIAVTGTKGKSSVVELVSAILEETGFKTAHASTIHFKVADKLERNLHKMTMPGRFFLQRLLRRAVRAGCTHAVIEMTSEGARQFRHKFIALDALIFTNLAPEHIESHGSYENYVAAKVSLARALEKSPLKKGALPSSAGGLSTARKTTPVPHFSEKVGDTPFVKGDKLLVVNGDDKEAQKFLDVFSGTKIVYSKKDAIHPVVSSEGVSFDWLKPSPIGEGSPEHSAGQNVLGNGVRIESKLPGEFNLYNILAAVSYAKAAGVPIEKICAGIAKVKSIRGRAERITLEHPLSISPSKEVERNAPREQDFTVIVDYAHTPDSLEKLYQTYSGKYRICVLGNTGGGRDKWKRPVMASIAEKYCDEIILTNEDPYDEDPETIIREMAAGMGNNPRTSERVAPFVKGDNNPPSMGKPIGLQPGQPPLVRGVTTPAHQNVSPPLLRGITTPAHQNVSPPLLRGITTPAPIRIGAPPLVRGIQPTLILARRAAIRAALQKASKGDVVLITGKGTDPYIMGAHGSREPWDDATVVREELKKILSR